MDWRLIAESSDLDRLYVPSRREVEGLVIVYYLGKNNHGFVREADITAVNDAIKNAREFDDSVGRYSINKALFATTNGLRGLGPKSIKPGDEVWLVRDARMLFVVRPREQGDYELLGESYVYRCMNGELMKYAEEKWRDLKLR